MSNHPIFVRNARPADAALIADFNVKMALETEDHVLDPAVVEPGVQAILKDAAKGNYFVAESDGDVVGCLLITHEWSDWRNGDLWWIQSVYVQPDARGQGVFRKMYQHVEAAAKAAEARGIRLYVERENANAQATYRKMGMDETPYRVMEVMFPQAES